MSKNFLWRRLNISRFLSAICGKCDFKSAPPVDCDMGHFPVTFGLVGDKKDRIILDTFIMYLGATAAETCQLQCLCGGYWTEKCRFSY